MRILLITAALAAAPILAGCGGDSESVTAAELSRSLQSNGVQDVALADCAAKIYVDEGISQDGLRTLMSRQTGGEIADPEQLGMSEDDAARAHTATNKIVADCSAG